MDWKNKNVLITGACGFIGGHLTGRLVAAGANVTGIYYEKNSSSSYQRLVSISQRRPNLRLRACNICKKEELVKVVENQDYIFHLAAQPHVGNSIADPESTFTTNVTGTLNLLLAAWEAHKKREISRILIVSTALVYGTPKYCPIDEEHPLQALSPYAASKIAAEKYAESFFNTYKIPITIVRPFNTYGPGQLADAVIPKLITQALNTNEILFFGDPRAVRDFVYVDDLVEAFLMVASAPTTTGATLNIGCGTDARIQEVAALIIDICNSKKGKQVALVMSPEEHKLNHADVARLCANPQKIQKLTSWQPRTSLQEGLGKTVAWFEKQIR